MESNYILRDRTFETRHLNLPRYTQLKIFENENIGESSLEIVFSYINQNNEHHDLNKGPFFILDYARLSDLEMCSKFVDDASVIGDNIGEDEFENDQLFKLMKISEVFVLKSFQNQSCQAIKAFISLQPCFISRTVDTCQTEIGIYYDQEWINSSKSWSNNVNIDKEVIYAGLILLGIQLAKDIQIGYTDAIVKVCPKTHSERLLILERIGFSVVACIPNGVTINENDEEDCVLMKNFAPPRQPRSMREIIQKVDDWYRRDEEDEMFNETPFLDIPFMPLKYKTQKGKIILIRAALKSEVNIMYNLFEEAGLTGNGYSTNEYPTLGYFKSTLLKSYNIIYEICDENNLSENKSSIIGCSMLYPSWYARSTRSKSAASALVIKERFKSLGFGKELIVLERYFMKKLGFKRIVNDFLEDNIHMRKAIDALSGKVNDLTVGLIPRSAFTMTRGWLAVVVRFSYLENLEVGTVLEEIEKKIIYVSTSKL